MSRLTAACLFAALAGAAAAQPPALAPPAPIPTLMTGRVVDGSFEHAVPETVPVQQAVTVTGTTPDGRPVQRVKTGTTFQVVRRTVRSSLDRVSATGADGRVIPKDKLADLLKDESVVVVTYGAPAAEKYRKVFKDGTVFLTFPPPTMFAPGAGPKPPPGPDSNTSAP